MGTDFTFPVGNQTPYFQPHYDSQLSRLNSEPKTSIIDVLNSSNSWRDPSQERREVVFMMGGGTQLRSYCTLPPPFYCTRSILYSPSRCPTVPSRHRNVWSRWGVTGSPSEAGELRNTGNTLLWTEVSTTLVGTFHESCYGLCNLH